MVGIKEDRFSVKKMLLVLIVMQFWHLLSNSLPDRSIRVIVDLVLICIVIVWFFPSKVVLSDKGLILQKGGELISWDSIRRAQIQPVFYIDASPLYLTVETDIQTHESMLISYKNYFDFTQKAGLNDWTITGPSILLKGRKEVSKIRITYEAKYCTFWKRLFWWPIWLVFAVLAFQVYLAPITLSVIIVAIYSLFAILTALCFIKRRNDVLTTDSKLVINNTSVEYETEDIIERIELGQIRFVDEKFMSDISLMLIDGRKIILPSNYFLLYHTLAYFLKE